MLAWPDSIALLGVLAVVGTAILKLSPYRGRPMADAEMSPQQEQKFEAKLDRLQEDVNQLEVHVGNLQGEQNRTSQDVTGVRNELGELRRSLDALRAWLTEHVFGAKRE